MLFYADENFPMTVVTELRKLGHDVLTSIEDGRAKVLDRAIELERPVLTMNRIDFKRLHNLDSNHFGIVICTFDADFIGQARRIDRACIAVGDLKCLLVRVAHREV